MLKNKFINISSYLFYLIPIALITGPFIPDLFICLIGLFYIFYRNYKIHEDVRTNTFIKIFFIFYFYILIRSLFSENISLSLESSLFYFRFGIFVLAVNYLLKNNLINIKLTSNLYLIVLTFISIDCIFQFITGVNFIGLQRYGSRLSSFFTGYNNIYNNLVVGNYLARLLPISLALILMTFSINKKNIYIFIAYLNIVCLATLLSGERVTILNLTILIIFFSIINFGFRKYFIFNSLIIILASSVLILSNSLLKERLINETLKQIHPDHTTNFQIISSSHHPIIVNAYRNFKDNMVFGHGPKLYREICKKYDQKDNSCNTHPHNTYIQLLAETGLIGFSFIFIFFLIISFKIGKFLLINLNNYVDQKTTSYYLLLILIFSNLFIYQPTMNFFHNWISVIYYLPISFLFYFNEFKKN